jgi:hypothetical protein
MATDPYDIGKLVFLNPIPDIEQEATWLQHAIGFGKGSRLSGKASSKL